jgi:hypothetical protein
VSDVIRFDDEQELQRKRPNKVELTSADGSIPKERKRKFIAGVKRRAKQRKHAKACAKRNRN